MNFLIIILRCLMGFPPQPPNRLMPVLVRRDGRLASGSWNGRPWSDSEFREEIPLRSWFRLATLFQRLGDLVLRLRRRSRQKPASQLGRQTLDESATRKRTE